MLKTIVIIVLIAIAAVLIYASTKPDMLHVQRTVSIKATPDKIFPHINDLHAWEAWSPYLKLDPAMKTRYSGAAAGVGAVYEWEGNSKAGAGRVTIAQTTPPSKVAIKLDMLKPFEAHNDVAFTLEPKGENTEVTWAMDGPSTLLTKIMGLFINMDRMVGGEFEEGLAKLKALVET
jgi:carbon monoxide dehydrogenase subunit G